MQIPSFSPRGLVPSTLAVMLALAGASACAQQPPPADRGMAVATPATTVVTGTVRQWLLNPNGEADGVLLADGTQVAFPPHLSAEVQALVKPGGTLQVSGWRAPGVPVLRAVRLGIAGGGRQVAVAPPASPRAPRPPREVAALTAMSASGRVAQVLYTDRGDANGVLLDSGTVVRFAPHAGAQLTDTLQRGNIVHARGWGTRGAQGSALEATALGRSADSMQELFAGPAGTAGPGRPPRPGARGPGRPGPRDPGPQGVRPQPPVPGEAPLLVSPSSSSS